jgi:host factor-I protein
MARERQDTPKSERERSPASAAAAQRASAPEAKTGTDKSSTDNKSAKDNKNGKPMAAERPQSLQDTFLNHVRKNKTPLTIFLINGVKLQGIVTWFDNFCVLLRRDGHSQLVYKHAISTIMPGGPVHLMDSDPAEGAQS